MSHLEMPVLPRFAPALLAVALPLSALGDEVYFNDFQSAVGPGWSSATAQPWGIRSTPLPADDSRKFLGYFGGEDQVTLSLTDLPAGATSVLLEFDLYLMWSWDGSDTRPVNGVSRGPDEFGFSIDAGGGTPVSQGWTFSHGSGALAPQTYCPGATSPCLPTTGAQERYSLGYRFDILPTEEDLDSTTAAPMDSVYRLSMEVPLAAPAATFTFFSQGLQVRDDLDFPYLDEAWGLDNVRVSVAIPEPGSAWLVLGGLAVVASALRRARRA